MLLNFLLIFNYHHVGCLLAGRTVWLFLYVLACLVVSSSFLWSILLRNLSVAGQSACVPACMPAHMPARRPASLSVHVVRPSVS